MAAFQSAQWAFWPLGEELENRLRDLLERRFDQLFLSEAGGYIPGWFVTGPEILITWRPGIDRF
jgi:hypothetical protein